MSVIWYDEPDWIYKPMKGGVDGEERLLTLVFKKLPDTVNIDPANTISVAVVQKDASGALTDATSEIVSGPIVGQTYVSRDTLQLFIGPLVQHMTYQLQWKALMSDGESFMGVTNLPVI